MFWLGMMLTMILAQSVQWWSEWGFRITVVSSLGANLVVGILSGTRRRSAARWLWALLGEVAKLFVWLAYQVAEAAATSALGSLSLCGSDASEEEKQVVAFWAPFLLLHLGGPDNLTAYALEDNKISNRKWLEIGVRILVVIYTINNNTHRGGRSWALLLAASVVMLVAGVVRYVERAYALRKANLDSMQEDASSSSCKDDIKMLKCRIKRAKRQGQSFRDGEALLLAQDLFPIWRHALVDSSVNPASPMQKASEMILSEWDWESMCMVAEMELSLIYEFLYTKAILAHTWHYYLIRLLSPLFTAAAAFLFCFWLHPDKQQQGDDGHRVRGSFVGITYALLAITFLMDVAWLMRALGSTWAYAYFQAAGRRWWCSIHRIVVRLDPLQLFCRDPVSHRRWSGTIGRYNLLDECKARPWRGANGAAAPGPPDQGAPGLNNPRTGTGSSSITTTATTSGTRTIMTLSTSAYTTSSEPVRDEDEESAMELWQEEAVKTRRHMRGLVVEFRAGADGNATAPDRWLSELHVAWLLRLAEFDASGQRTFISRSRQLQSPAQTWIPALQVISTSVWKCLNGLHSDGEATVGPPATEFAQFLKATLLKMFTFVDAIVALDPLNVDGARATSQQHVPSSSVMGAAEKVRALLDVRHALSAASDQIMVAFYSEASVLPIPLNVDGASNQQHVSSTYVQCTKVADDIGGLLSAQLCKLDQAIRDTFDHIRTAVTPPSLDYDNDSSSATQTTLLQSSPAIHEVTPSVTNYINIVLSTEAFLTANYARHQGDTSSLTTLTMKVVGSLEEELARVSQSFPDQSLRFIFLINNSYLIWQLLDTSWPPHLHDLTYQFLDSLTNRIDRYIQSYLQVTWAPVLECLHNPTFRCFTRDSSLPKFESKFQSTYAAQKLWNVPDPELRKRLREAIIEKVVTGFKEYLEDHNSITPGVTPQELKEILQELFEG